MRFVFLTICIACFLLLGKSLAQISGDSMEIAKTNQLAQTHLFQKQNDKAIEYAKKALNLAEATEYESEQAKSFLFLGKAFRQKKNYYEALRNLLYCLRIYEKLYDDTALAEATTEVGLLFYEQKAYTKAIDYFTNAYSVYKRSSQIDKANQVLEYLAKATLLQGDMDNARKNYSTLLEVKRQEEDTTQIIYVLNNLVSIETALENFKDASQHLLELVKFYNAPSNISSLSAIYNNLGFISKRQGNLPLSIEYFNKSLSLYEKRQAKLPDTLYASLLENVGVAYANLKAYELSETFFNNALKIKQKINNKAEIAKTYNYLAANYYISDNQLKALETVNQAISLANEVNAEEVLITSYRILEMIYKNENLVKAQEYTEQVERMTFSMREKQRFEEQRSIDNNNILDKWENDLKQQILLDEQNQIRFRRLSAEAEKQARENERKENELKIQAQQIEILRREQKIKEIAFNNQRLESEKAQQMLELLREKNLAEQQKSLAERQQRRLDYIALEMKAKSVQEEQQKEIIEGQKKQLQAAKRLRNYGIAIIVLGAVVFLGVVVGMYITYRNNRELREKNSKIENQSRAISRQNQELELQRIAIQDKNRVLDLQNTKINESIRAAQTIQNAILPNDEVIASLFDDFFVLYKPKDIVSGDFYWVDKVENKVMIAAVDCTGHGVAGAFMSLIGNSLLDKIVEKLHIIEPATILNTFDHEIRATLNQEEGTEVGMDIAFCILEKYKKMEFYDVTFAGAGRPLYFYSKQTEELQEIKGDRKSVGMIRKRKTDFEYTQTSIQLFKGDSIYLFSDGFADQNNPEKEKIGTSRFKELLRKNANLPMQEQKQLLEIFLADFQKSEDQRDDILVIGLQL